MSTKCSSSCTNTCLQLHKFISNYRRFCAELNCTLKSPAHRRIPCTSVSSYMMAFHDADTDTDSPNTATILRLTHAKFSLKPEINTDYAMRISDCTVDTLALAVYNYFQHPSLITQSSISIHCNKMPQCPRSSSCPKLSNQP